MVWVLKGSLNLSPCKPTFRRIGPIQSQLTKELQLPTHRKHSVKMAIFAKMRQRLKFILLLLTSFCYFASVFEWDSKERNQNYAKENHSYVACVKTVDNFGSHVDTPIEIPTFLVNIQPSYFVSQKFILFSFTGDHAPPDKIYLLHSSLLI